MHLYIEVPASSLPNNDMAGSTIWRIYMICHIISYMIYDIYFHMKEFTVPQLDGDDGP